MLHPERLSDLAEPMATSIQAVCVEMELRGFPVFVSETVRTPERQADLVRRGMSKTMNSRHLPDAEGKAHAVDLVDARSLHGHLILWGASDPAWGLTDRQARERVEVAREFFRALGEEVAKHPDLEWGGSWHSFPDPAHIQETHP
jgi:peptidoglycan L-alanyl-D-glutamate endopeptidase CwlK